MAQSITLTFDKNVLLPALYGEHNVHLHHIENALGVQIADKGNTLMISGNSRATKEAADVLNKMWLRLENNQTVSKAQIDAALRFTQDKKMTKKKIEKTTGNIIATQKKNIAPRSPNQGKYIDLIQNHSMVFGLGPAGTGKTYLAVAMGVSMFLAGKVERLIFCRPAVEAGENLGFLPGDMREKVDPYLRPVYDAMHDMLPREFVQKKLESGDIEVAPLAFMRGRTLSNAFCILDEAQNTTPTQMKMFLTRMGETSHMVITGDLSQTDLPSHIKSGLRDAVETLENVNDIGFMRFEGKDVIRHPLVSKIVKAYDMRKKD